jgi:hypothetical protein
MSSQSNRQNDGEERLRYLGFFQDAAQKATARLSSIYGHAREKSGSLKQGVYAMEGAVKVFVMPVYQKVEGKPFEILQFADKKVGNVIDKLDSCVPPALKSRTCEFFAAAKRASEVARSVVTEVRQVGAVEKIKEVAKILYAKSEPSAKNLYNKYEPVAEKWSLLAWYKLRQFPFVPQIVEALIPPSAYCVEKYNYGVQYLSDGEYRVAACLPIVPVEKIKNAIYRELERKEDKPIEITHESEDKVDSSDSD